MQGVLVNQEDPGLWGEAQGPLVPAQRRAPNDLTAAIDSLRVQVLSALDRLGKVENALAEAQRKQG